MMIQDVPRRTQTRARKARDKIDKMVAEQKQWQGTAPKLVRVNMGDYLALVECDWINDGMLSGTSLEVRAG